VIEVEVAADAWTAAEPEAERLAAGAAEATLAAEGRADAGAIAILLADDETVRALNARFRGKDSPTNVLAFPAPPMTSGHLGDVALAYGVCVREAAAQGKTLGEHLVHLAAHGVLHLLGYDHQTDAEAESMEARERLILATLGVPDPYAPRGEAGDHG